MRIERKPWNWQPDRGLAVKATCTQCTAVRFYAHKSGCDIERCPECPSLAFGLRRTEVIRAREVPKGADVFLSYEWPAWTMRAAYTTERTAL